MMKILTIAGALALATCGAAAPAYAAQKCVPPAAWAKVSARLEVLGFRPLANYRSNAGPTILIIVKPDTGNVAAMSITPEKVCLLDEGTGFGPGGTSARPIPGEDS